MKVFILFKTQFQEEDWGGMATAPSILIGVFTDKPSAALAKIEAEEVLKKQPASFGSEYQEILIIEVETNQFLEIKTYPHEEY